MASPVELAEVVARAEALLFQYQVAAALREFEAAEAIARERTAAAPHVAMATYDLGRVLYAKASCLLREDRVTDALAALDECEGLYASLVGRGRWDTELLIADVHLRRGVANARRGFRVTAVVDFDRGVSTYVGAIDGSPGSRPDSSRNFARALALNAHKGCFWLDPDLAVASADRAIGMYLSPGLPDIGQDPTHAIRLCEASEVASEIHGAHGRSHIGLEADHIGIRTARKRVDANDPEATRFLAEALARAAMHLVALGKSGEAARPLAEAGRIDPAAVARVVERRHRVQAGDHPALHTLSAALERASARLGSRRVDPSLKSTLVADPVASGPPGTRPPPVVTPSARCHPRLGAVLAMDLAGLAAELLPIDVMAGTRLGLEAHFLLAAASRAQTAALRYQFSEYGETWARVLLDLSRAWQAKESLPLALDLAQWSFAAAYYLDGSSPAIGADGTVYVAAANGDLYALTAPATGTTGVVRWVTHVEDQVLSSPAIGADGTVYIASVDGRLSAF